MTQLVVPFLAIGVLYATIWPHELGHAAVAYLSGLQGELVGDGCVVAPLAQLGRGHRLRLPPRPR